MNKMELEYSAASIRRLLEKLHYFSKAKESGNVDAIVILIDLKTALEKCILTDKQKEIFQYRYIWAYTVEETAKHLKIAAPTVIFHENAIAGKLGKVLNGEVVE